MYRNTLGKLPSLESASLLSESSLDSKEGSSPAVRRRKVAEYHSQRASRAEFPAACVRCIGAQMTNDKQMTHEEIIELEERLGALTVLSTVIQHSSSTSF